MLYMQAGMYGGYGAYGTAGTQAGKSKFRIQTFNMLFQLVKMSVCSRQKGLMFCRARLQKAALLICSKCHVAAAAE